MDYKKLAEEVLSCLGGKENIVSHTHCVTRLRFQIADRSMIREDELKKIAGVKGVMDKGGIYQVIIGPDVDKAYVGIKEMCGSGKIQEPKKTNDKPHEAVLNYISASIAPALPVLTFAGFMLVILNLLSTFGILTADGPTYSVLDAFANAGMYYLPVFVAIGAARRLKANEVLAAMIALMTLHPNFLGAETLQFLGINLIPVQYNGNIIPMLLTMPVYAWAEHKLNDHLPAAVRTILKPLLSVGLMIPLILFVTGPVGSVVTKWLAELMVLMSNFGAISLGLMTLINPVLVMTGMHTILLPLGLNEMSTLGYTTIMVKGLLYNMAITGATLAVAMLAKKKENKDNAVSAAITSLFGTTEPGLYGVVLRFRTPFIATMLGGGIAGVLAGSVNLKIFAFAAPSLLTFPAFIHSDYPMNIVWAIVVSVTAFAASFGITYLLKIKEEDENE